MRFEVLSEEVDLVTVEFGSYNGDCEATSSLGPLWSLRSSSSVFFLSFFLCLF